MARANYQVLVIPFCIQEDGIKYGVFKRADMNIWQFISGGGEDKEMPAEAAKREAYEEAGIDIEHVYYALDTCCSISVDCFGDANRKAWGEDCLVIQEHTFAVQLQQCTHSLSHEHTACEWVDYETAVSLLRYDSNKVALGELDHRIKNNKLKPIQHRSITTSKIRYSFTKKFDPQDVEQLFESVQWKSASQPEKLVRAFEQSSMVISAWDSNQLVGLVRALDDGIWQATIDCLLVNPTYQGCGIASQLMKMLKEEYKEILYLNVVPEEKVNVPFYTKHDFIAQQEATLMQITKIAWFEEE